MSMLQRSMFAAAGSGSSAAGLPPSFSESPRPSYDTMHLQKGLEAVGSLVAGDGHGGQSLVVGEEEEDEEGVLPYRGEC